MTATLTALDADQVNILASYGAGDSIATIVQDTGLTRALVANTIDQMCRYDRARAAQLVADHEAGQSLHRRHPEPEPEPEPAPELVEDPQPVAGDEQDDEDDEPEHAHADVDVNDLLLRAAVWASGFPNIGKLVDRIRRAVDELAPAVDAASQESAARAKVEQLRAQLAAAEDELRQVAQPTGRESTLPAGVTAKMVRAWATGAGVACPDRGKVPQVVVDAYVAAHREVTA